MKKIMFNDKYGLTKAVLEGRKTQTRRILKCPKKFGGKDVSGFRICTNKQGLQFLYLVDEDECEIEGSVNILPVYKIGEEVAVAQKYSELEYGVDWVRRSINKEHAGWGNKMFVSAEEMPHRIKITHVRVERLQDISDEDCLKEGVEYSHKGGYYVSYDNKTGSRTWLGKTPKEAFASLIDKVSGKGTWDSNPYVFVYDFELVK